MNYVNLTSTLQCLLYLIQSNFKIVLCNLFFQATALQINETPYIFIINEENYENSIPYVDIWRMDSITKLFYRSQTAHIASPVGVSAIQYKNNYYFAIASGHLQNSMYKGFVQIRK